MARVASPALKSKEDYFAEAAVSFFSSRRFRNDQYPFIHQELESFDPEGYNLMNSIWMRRAGNAAADAATTVLSYDSRSECRIDWIFPVAGTFSLGGDDWVATCLIVTSSKSYDG